MVTLIWLDHLKVTLQISYFWSLVHYYNAQQRFSLLSMPLVDGLNVSEDHPILAVSQRLRHRDFRIFGFLRLLHVLDVLTALLQIADVDPLWFQQLLESITSLLYRLLDFCRIKCWCWFWSFVCWTCRACWRAQLSRIAPILNLKWTEINQLWILLQYSTQCCENQIGTFL